MRGYSPLPSPAPLRVLVRRSATSSTTSGKRRSPPACGNFLDEVCREVGNSRRSELCSDRRSAEATKRFHESVGIAHAEINPLPSGKFVVTDPEKKIVLPSVSYTPRRLRSFFEPSSSPPSISPPASVSVSSGSLSSGPPPKIVTGSMPRTRTDAFHPQHLFGSDPRHSLDISSGTSAL